MDGHFRSLTVYASASSHLSIAGLILVFGGLVSTVTLVSILKSSGLSVTTTAVINLILVHYLFLLTVPFRIHYYAYNEWRLSPAFCRLVSATLHGHMFLSFIFYVIILVIRDIGFFKRTSRLAFYRRLHAVAFSASIWLVIFGILFPVTFSNYGTNGTNGTNCFRFGSALKDQSVRILNYVISCAVLLTVLAFTGCQLYILIRLLQLYKMAAFKHQEFWAQVKSFLFVLIMIVCFFPYHIFRIYYVVNFNNDLRLEGQNEVFLAVNALSCFDMLIFLGKCRWATKMAFSCVDCCK
uniref:G protein-coupled receptor 141 n=1 Tax=Paramormyrops kingsleyae TaxID=1676925 RepID=A0A3B3S7V7_9TELE